MKALLQVGFDYYAFADAIKAAQAASLLADSIPADYNSATGKYEAYSHGSPGRVELRTVRDIDVDIPELDRPKKRTKGKSK